MASKARRASGVAVALTATAALIATVATSAPAGPNPAPGARAFSPGTFAFAIGNGMLAGPPTAVADRLGDFGLVVVDGEEAGPGEIAALRGRGTTVLAYLSVGTIERWRSWFHRVKRFRLAAWRDWEDEWYADVSKAALRRILATDIAPEILAKGFDGLFLDNVDMVEPARHRPQRTGMAKLVRMLRGVVDDHGGLLFAQNGLWGLRKLDLVGELDGWNREDVTWSYDFDRHRYRRQPNGQTQQALRELGAMRDRGLITTATDYTASATGPPAAKAIANACGAGALPYISDIGLTAKRLPSPPIVCE